MLEPVLKNPWVRAIGAVALLVVVAILLYLLSPILVSLFFAFLVAYILDPVVDFFEERRVSRSLSIAGLAAIGIALLVAVPLFLIPTVIDQADSLAESARERSSADDGVGGVLSITDKLPLRSLVESMGLVDPEAEDYDPNYNPMSVLTVYAADWVKVQGVQMLKGNAGTAAAASQAAGSRIAGFLASLGRGAMGLVLFLGNVALFSVVAAYLLKDYDSIVATTRDLIPAKYRGKSVEMIGKINEQIRSFLRGQMLVCLFLGIFYAVGLSIAGVPFALVIGLFGMFASFIPYLGLTMTAAPAVVLCIMQYQAVDLHLLGVAATFIIAQMLEGMVLTPRIVGDKVGLSPVWVILAVMVFGNALGFLGLLLAVPIAASLKVVVVEGLDHYRKSALYTES
jgi:predicted PurR-regulated permease PerM